MDRHIQCISSCLNLNNCYFVSYEKTRKQCNQYNTPFLISQTIDSPGINVYYNIRFPPEGYKLSGLLKQTIPNANAISLNCIAVLQTGDLVSGGDDCFINIWEKSNNYILKSTLYAHTSAVSLLLVLNNGNLVSGSKDKSIKIWNTITWSPKYLPGHADFITGLAEMSNLDLLASSSLDNSIKLWNQTSGQCIQTYNPVSKQITALISLQNGNDLAAAIIDNTILIVDPLNNKIKQTLTGHTGLISSLILLNSGDLVSGSADKQIKIWDSNNNLNIKSTFQIGYEIKCLTILQNGYLAAGTNNNSVLIADTSSSFMYWLYGHTSPVNSLTVLQNGCLASVSNDLSIKIWF